MEEFALTVEQVIVELLQNVSEEIGLLGTDDAKTVFDKLHEHNKIIHRFVKEPYVEEFVALIEDDEITSMTYVFVDTVEQVVKYFTLDRELIALWQKERNDKNLEAPLH